MSLRTRIAAVAGLAVALTVLSAAVIVYAAVRSNLRGEVETALEDRAELLVAAREGPGPAGVRGFEERVPPPLREEFPPPPGDDGPPRGVLPFAPVAPPRFGEAEGFFQLVTPAGTTLRPSGENEELPVGKEAKDVAAAGEGRRFDDVHVGGTHLRVLTEGIGDRGAVQVARPLSEVDNVLDKVLIVLIAVGAVGIGLAAVLGALVARAALRPIERFTRRTEEIAGDPDISERIEVAGRDELARLAQSFNTTLDGLEHAVESQRQLVADASHELRTPIASLRANIQTLDEAERLPRDELEALRADIIEELDELTALVGAVVELARGERPATRKDDVRLDELVQNLVERAQRRGDGTVAYELSSEPTVVRGEPDKIGRAVSNLLDNARKWSPPGATVDVQVGAGTVTVRDRGPGFADEDLPHVFERFYRAKDARSMAGSGLGLAIVRQAAKAHGGSAEAANAPDGGAVLRVSFGEPLAVATLARPGG